MCSFSAPSNRNKPEPDEVEFYYRTDPVPHSMPIAPGAIDADRLRNRALERSVQVHIDYWSVWFLELGQEKGEWVGASWALIDREVFVAAPGATRGVWLFWELIRLVVFAVTLGKVRLEPETVDVYSRIGLRRAFWTLVHYKMLTRGEKVFDGVTLEVFYPTAELAKGLNRAALDPARN